MRIYHRLWPFALGGIVLACRDSSQQAAASSGSDVRGSPPTARASASASLTYRGAGFEFELPAGSSIGRGRGTDTLEGPLVTEDARSPDLGGPGPHPTFRIEVSVTPNPRGIPLTTWADSVYREDSTGAEDFAKPGPVERDSLGSEPALRFQRFCGDCEAQAFYAAHDGQVVSLAYAKGIHLAGTPTEQEVSYRRVLRTFRWVQ